MLTKAEAIRNHRLMWNWIAQTSIQEQRCVSKQEATEHFGWPKLRHDCWCCQYAYEQNGVCSKCPMLWNDGYQVLAACCTRDSAYTNWLFAFKRNNYTIAAKYAHMIAELPERRI